MDWVLFIAGIILGIVLGVIIVVVAAAGYVHRNGPFTVGLPEGRSQDD